MLGLVDYSSSSDSEQDASQNTRPLQNKKSKRTHTSDKTLEDTSSSGPPSSTLPPLPSSFHDLYAASARVSTSDDPSLHGGRKRVTPHVEGNWPSHVYLEWHPSPTELVKLERLLSAIPHTSTNSNQNLTTLLTSPLGAPFPLHISLSTSLVLRTEQRTDFLDALTSALSNGNSNLQHFKIPLLSLAWAANEKATRWFLVLRAGRPEGDALNRLLGVCNGVVAGFGLPQLYKREASAGKAQGSARKAGKAAETGAEGEMDYTQHFHFSIAWTLVDPTPNSPPKASEVVDIPLDAVPKEIIDDVLAISPEFDAVKVKIGNIVHSIDLNERGTERKRRGSWSDRGRRGSFVGGEGRGVLGV